MKKLSLNGAWTLDVTAQDGAAVFTGVPANVPGSVYADLLAAGKMADPFYRDNEDAALALMAHEFIYTKTFDVPDALRACDALALRFDGLDTLATVALNGEVLLEADNMHRTWEVPLDAARLKREGNALTVTLHSPTAFVHKAAAEGAAAGVSDAMRGFTALRKAHCMFGWDWGPHLPDAGIWRDVTLLGIERGRLADVRVRQTHQPDGAVRVSVSAKVAAVGGAACEVRFALFDPDGAALSPSSSQIDGAAFRVAQPRRWWPAGYGEQPLYTVRATLVCEGHEVDRWEKRIGLRTLTVRRERDEWGESFCFCANGVDVFCMGADYIPEDNLLSRVTPGRTRRLLEDARAANMNAIRVWGGGCFPGDDFFDICDELGLMVWQDFMFACAMYNLDAAFEANVRAEIVDNVRRLRHHPSLALWCGNNEMEGFVVDHALPMTKGQIADYVKLYEYIIPKVLEAEDPDRFYWPSSASSGGSFDDPNAEDRGDCHYWEVWHGLKPFTEYRRHRFRFASEFGFQSFPCMATIEGFTEPGDRNPFSYIMEKHQRNASANGRIAEYLSQTYLYPNSFDAFVYASQLLQAQAMQYGVEHWRRHRGQCMGALVWQLNDCWPVVSWSSIDYHGRWKALHYYEKRFFAPVLVSCEEEGILSQNTNVNAEGFVPDLRFRLNVSNETTAEVRGTVRWSLRRPDASILREGAAEVCVPALSALWLEGQDCNDVDVHGAYVSYALEDASGRRIGGGTALFCAPKHFRFEDPALEARLEGDAVVVRARAYARSVEIRCGADVVLEDNFFDMDAGERRVRVLRGTPGAVSARSVFDIR